MRHLAIILALLITSFTTSWAQESAENRLDEVIELRGQAKELSILKEGWSAYKLGDYKAALNLWMPLAETGNPSAQVFIGLMYDQGHAVEQDKNEAEKWYALASEQEHASAKWRLALLYFHGSGITQDLQKAAKLYHSAAKQGDVYSQKQLGILYSKGLGVSKDNILAYSWFHIAGENGFGLAQKFENEIELEMTPEETVIALSMAKNCIQSSYTECGWALGSKNKSTTD